MGSVRWIDDYEVHSPSEISPIDGRDLETLVSCNVFNAFDYVCRPAVEAAAASSTFATSSDNSTESVNAERIRLANLSLNDNAVSEQGAFGGATADCLQD